jgi:hypothetical protein
MAIEWGEALRLCVGVIAKWPDHEVEELRDSAVPICRKIAAQEWAASAGGGTGTGTGTGTGASGTGSDVDKVSKAAALAVFRSKIWYAACLAASTTAVLDPAAGRLQTTTGYEQATLRPLCSASVGASHVPPPLTPLHNFVACS